MYPEPSIRIHHTAVPSVMELESGDQEGKPKKRKIKGGYQSRHVQVLLSDELQPYKRLTLVSARNKGA